MNDCNNSNYPHYVNVFLFSETSPKIVSTERRDVNVRAQLAGHLCGIRHAGLAKLVGVPNLPSPVQDDTYSKWDKQLLEFVKSTSEKSMARAVEDAVATANTTDLTVSGDDFWQTRGFQSSHGAAALFFLHNAPQVLDIETCSKTCSVCKDKPVQKVEDLNHFSKRMKRSLNTIRREYGRKKLSDGKTIGGKNRLSGEYCKHGKFRCQMKRVLILFSSDYTSTSNDIRLNHSKVQTSLDLLHARSWAIFWHKYSTNDDPRLKFCSDEWCDYLKSVRDGTSYDHTSHALPRPVLDAIKRIFDSL
ncbi:unnamed protein product [Rotaria magnacalcarata]|uniref:Mutator-like transposase domain-containing protein n=1 Tax=Rotaria magnacalcarata TaxID=392030 RepID=A0A816RDU6_9BILA|nr:unnamed protein product [Rotaria magnacalcarata]